MHLISDEMLELNKALHQHPAGYGGSGWRHADEVARFARKLGATSVLDYGCGEGTLRKKLKSQSWKFREYDPAIQGKDKLPAPADLVVCTDVLEHIEPDNLDRVIDHICSLSMKGCFAIAACRPASKLLPDGRNAHLIIEPPKFWLDKIERPTWRLVGKEIVMRKDEVSHHEVRMWLRRATK